MSIYENNRDLADTTPHLGTAEIHFDLEGIAIRPYPIHVYGFQSLSSEAFKPASAVRDLKPGNHPGIEIGQIAEHKAPQWPVHHAYPV